MVKIICEENVIVLLLNLGLFIPCDSSPIHNRQQQVPNSQLNYQQGSYHQQNGGVNGPVHTKVVQPSYPAQINYNNDNTDYHGRFHRSQNPSNSQRDSHHGHNNLVDDSHKITQPVYVYQQNPQFQNYLYQKQNLHSRQKTQDLNERASQPQQPQTYGQGQVQLEQICTSAGCRNRNSNDQVKSHQNQNAVYETQQPQVYQYNTNNEKSRYKGDNYVIDSNKNFLHPTSVGAVGTVPIGSSNINNRANVLDNRQGRSLENNEIGQRVVHPHRLYANSFVGPLAVPITNGEAKNKGVGSNTGLVKIEFDFADKDDTFETTMELVPDEL